MTVKDAMDTIKFAKECVKFLYQEANAEQDEHIKRLLNRIFRSA
jgi:hypothetical protein